MVAAERKRSTVGAVREAQLVGVSYGRQRVAVASGVGGWAGAIVSGELDARDQTAALGFVHAMRDLPQATKKGGTLYVFALP